MLIPPLPTVGEVQAALLAALRDEGDQALWEAAWRLDCGPGQRADIVKQKVALARAATLGLLERSEIGIWRMDTWPPVSYAAVDRAAFLSVQHHDLLWVDPTNAPYLFEVRPIGNLIP